MGTRLSSIKSFAKFAVGVVLVIPALCLVAFGPRSRRELPHDRVIVTYWEKWTDFEGAAMQDVVAYFNDTVGAEQGIFVDYVVTTQIDFKTLVATAGGDPPDLVGLWLYNVSSFASRGALQSLDRFAVRSGIDEDLIIPTLFSAGRYHDSLYALPLTPWTLALYYNKTLFAEFADELREAGLSAERPPRTLAELMEYAGIIHRRGDDGEIELMAFLPGFPETLGWFWYTWGLWFGGSFFDADTGEVRLDSDAFVQGYRWVQQYAEQFGTRDILRFESGLANFNSPDNPFMIRKLAMVQQGPFFANMIRQYAPDIDYGVAPFPTATGEKIGFCAADVLAIPTGAHHADEAWVFMNWLYTSRPAIIPSRGEEPRAGHEYYIEITDSGPQRRPMPPMLPVEWLCWSHYKNVPMLNPSPGFFESHPNPDIEVHERAARGPHTHTAPPLPNWSEVLVEFVAAYREIWGDGADAGDRLRECQRRVDVVVAQTKRRMERYKERYP